MSVEVSIDDFDSSQLERIYELFGSYFPATDKLLTAPYTDWLYAQNPFGVAKMVTATEGGRWVGFMAMIPVRLIRRGSQVLGYYVVNVLVHPQHLGKNIFGRLITAAKVLVESAGAVLMGHPNDMALKAWQRSGMHFQEPLLPALIVPRLFGNGMKSMDVQDPLKLLSILLLLLDQASHSDHWSIELTPEYASWRYLKHPTNTYRVQQLEAHGHPVGVLVTRKVKPGINLLVDQFILDAHQRGSLACAPWLTVTFRSKATVRNSSRSMWLLPLKRKIPFFFTFYSHPAAASEAMGLGLSASDF